MRREIKLCLVYRDMWQSAGKYVPRVDQLVKVAEPIIEMGCFDRVETNGGGFEQVNLLFGKTQTPLLESGPNPLMMLVFRLKCWNVVSTEFECPLYLQMSGS